MKTRIGIWISLMAAALCLGVGPANGGIYDAWSKQVAIRFATPLQGAVSNFPVLIRLDPATIPGFNYADFASPSDGADLRFTGLSGTTPLNYEIEKWNPDGVSSVWVQVPGIASTNDGIKAWWGRSGAVALPCTTNGAVWGSTHLGVWHMNDNTVDATSRKNHGVNYGTAATDGITAGGRNFSSSSYIDMPANLRTLGATNAFAITFWFKSASAASGSQCLMEDGTAYNTDSVYLFANAAAKQIQAHVRANTSVGLDAIAVPSISTDWHAMAHVYDGATVRTYFDGVQKWSAAVSGGIASGNTHLQLGRRPGGASWFIGAMDEVRIENVSRPADWIHACWLSQKPDSDFVAFGEVTGVGSPSIAFVSAYATTPGSALLTGSLTSTGLAATVVGVAYGKTDGGEVMGAWDVTSPLGAGPFTVFPAACTTTVSVASGETYYCRFWASNSYGVVWSYQPGKWMAGEVWVAGAGASADEGGAPAVITLGRPGWATNSTLQVAYAMSGTAQNGTDYTALNGLATFAVGATNATVSISAGNDARFEGPETATLTLAGGAYAVGAPSQATVTINDAQKTRYVAKFGSNTSPYDTWAKAATSIQPAVTAAVVGDLVLVSNGVYTSATTGYIVTVDKAITMRSLNGHEVTIIDPLVGTTSTARNTLSLTAAAAGAIVDGFTMQGTYDRRTQFADKAVILRAGTMTNCVIRNNTVTSGVGGVEVSGTGRLVDSVVTNNLCTEWQQGQGGGVYLAGANAIVERCVIGGNESQTWVGGGGVYQTAGTLRNCLVVNNRASYYPLNRDPATYFGKGAGVRMTGGRIENCTISGNTAVDKGAGIYMTAGSVSNSVIWFNTASDRFDASVEDFFSSGGVKGRNCHPLASGAGNVAGDPQFANAAGGDYTLLPGSPCLDAAGTLATFANDRNGTARPIGAAWDIGAYEMPTVGDRPFTCNFSAPVTETLNGLTADFTAYVAGANTTITSYRWLFGDGAEAEGAALSSVSHTYTTGWFTVTLTVSNALGQVASRTKSDYIKANPSDLYVDTTGSHTFPFNTPAKAAHNIAAAVAAAPNSVAATVWVSDGTWSMPGQVVIDKAVTVRSVNGPTNCTTTVPAQNRSFYMHHPEAVVAGFTMTAAYRGDHNMNGAGVYLIQGTVTNCIFRDIEIGGRGAAIWMTGGRVVDCQMINNRSYEGNYGYGGALFIDSYTFFGGSLVENCRIERNECVGKNGGGGVYMLSGILRNNLIVSNRASRTVAGTEGIGGGVLMRGGVLENCTVTRNFSVNSGGGAYILATTAATVTNSIVMDNTVSIAAAGERNLYNSGGLIGYSCIDPAPAGAENTALDPQFKDAAALDFRLKTASPCVDKGLNAAWMTGAVDLDHAVRRQNGTVDMGCYESPDPWSGPLIAGFSASPSTGYVSQEVVFTAEPVGLDTNIVAYSWNFGDGHSVSGAGRPVVTNTYAAGYYDVTLILQNQGGEVATNSRLSYIQIAPAMAYVSTNGTAVAPYMTWGTAAKTLQDALAVVSQGEAGAHTIVAVTSGVYTVGAVIALNSANTILGVGHVEDVVIRGISIASRVFTLTSPEVTLSGLTIRGGDNGSHLYDGGGVYMTAGLLTNCIIRNNRAGGMGGGVYQSGGVVARCIFRENFASEHGAAKGGGLYTQGGLVKDCIFDNNRVYSYHGGGGVFVNGGTVRNCLLTRNYSDMDEVADGPGGGATVAAGRLESCTVATNWALANGGGIYMTGGIVSNTVVADNYVTVSGAANWHNPMASVGHCLSPDLPDNPAKGNIAGRPVFENAAAGNYRLARNSPGLDTGRNQAWMTGARDLAGSPRVWLGRWPRVAPQDTVDMGCYELILPPQGTMMILR